MPRNSASSERKHPAMLSIAKRKPSTLWIALREAIMSRAPTRAMTPKMANMFRPIVSMKCSMGRPLDRREGMGSVVSHAELAHGGGHEHVLAEPLRAQGEILPVVGGQLELVVEDDGIESAALHAELAEDAALHLEVVAHGEGHLAPLLLALLDGDHLGGADLLAGQAADALDLALLVLEQRQAAPVAGLDLDGHLGVLGDDVERHLAPVGREEHLAEVLARDGQALGDVGGDEGPQELVHGRPLRRRSSGWRPPAAG